MATLLLEDIFRVTDIDPDGKKFDKGKIEAHSEQFDMHLLLDVNCDVYPLHRDEKFTMALAPTLSLDGTPDEGVLDQSGKRSLADRYDYVMYGKLYKYSDDHSTGALKVDIYVSFGGLLMKLKGDPQHLNELQMDQRLYVLLRKVK
ncbi:hypothetical protein SELMODRAFT_105067 [Selaginella moellendorffii]|uniref:DNA-directed RNA polymerases I, II, and III subunit RPABC3 n=1 Tax=Selaginella moellendorffii TaxID=88036 RepID=D8RZ42_SELML|nr:hypothetical protein SELMODRAFT_105067 [Selaginella moellendorffii]